MSQFNTLTVKSIRQLTADSVEICFEIPDELADYYSYEHGQFIALRATIDGELVERSYSICRAPYERQLSIAVKQVNKGIFSSFATSVLKEGDSIEVSEPKGTFTCALDSSKANNYLFIAAGSGITPIVSILKMVLASEPKSQCVLMFGNKTAAGVMFLDELEALKQRYPERIQIIWVFSQGLFDEKTFSQARFLQVGEIHYGRIKSDLVETVLNQIAFVSPTKTFLCGPEKMTLTLREHYLEQGVSSENIKVELFSVVDSVGSTNGVSSAKISLMIDGEHLEVIYEDKTESILEHALRIDPDLPYGCQNGSCGACQAKIISGKARMSTNYALSDSEVEDGYILLCQAHPETEFVAISYDE